MRFLSSFWEWHGGWAWLSAGGLAVAGAVAAVATGTALAASSPSGTVTETINVGVRSLTVSTASVSMCSSSSPLTFPNGSCNSPSITITNGPAGGHIDVNGADAVPSDQAGNSWALCSPSGTTGACSGSTIGSADPGQDQYQENTAWLSGLGTASLGPFLTSTPQCDTAFDQPSGSGCTSTSGQATTEFVQMLGPSTSTDQSPTFTTSITWTAAP